MKWLLDRTTGKEYICGREHLHTYLQMVSDGQVSGIDLWGRYHLDSVAPEVLKDFGGMIEWDIAWRDMCERFSRVLKGEELYIEFWPAHSNDQAIARGFIAEHPELWDTILDLRQGDRRLFADRAWMFMEGKRSRIVAIFATPRGSFAAVKMGGAR